MLKVIEILKVDFHSYACESFPLVDKLISTIYSIFIAIDYPLCHPCYFYNCLISDDSLLSVIWEEKEKKSPHLLSIPYVYAV